MHPTLARYLNLEAAVDTLRRDELQQALRAEERPYAEVAQAHPELRALVLAARGLRHPSEETQQALLVLAAHATVAALREDPQLGGRLLVAQDALRREGASDEEVDQFIATLVLEEAFGASEDVDTFDRAFFEDTLREVPELAKLTPERVSEIGSAFVKTASEDWRKAHEVAARALIDAAWVEGPAPINVEHLQEAIETLRTRLAPSEHARGLESLRRFVTFLVRAGLVQRSRQQRLEHTLDAQGTPPAPTEKN